MTEAEDAHLLDPARARVAARQLEHTRALRAAREVICRAGEVRPADLAAPSAAWSRALADAVDVVLSAAWPHSGTTPDGVGILVITPTTSSFGVDAVLYLLPRGTRHVRLEFDPDGGAQLRVAEASETSRAARRGDPRREMRWELTLRISPNA